MHETEAEESALRRTLLRTRVTQEGPLTGSTADKRDLFGTRTFYEVFINVVSCVL